MQPNTLVRQLASTIEARRNCEQTIDTHAEWFARHTRTIGQLVSDLMPSGSGWDCGTKIDLDASHADKLVFYGSYHHMNDGGFYDGWTEHTITVTPSLAHSYHVRVSGRNRNDIKEWLHEEFSYALETRIVWDAQAERWRNEKFVGQPTIAGGN